MLKIHLALLLSFAALMTSCSDSSKTKVTDVIEPPSKQDQRQGYVLEKASIKPKVAHIEWRQTESWPTDTVWQLPLPLVANELRCRHLPSKTMPAGNVDAASSAARLFLWDQQRKFTLTAELTMDNEQEVLKLQFKASSGSIAVEYIGVPANTSLQDFLSYSEFIDVTKEQPVIFTISGQEIHLSQKKKNKR